ncbi:ExeA family protein [Massilia psychrophila]|uniref:Peptidoglycan-binding protein n=1 Tax=Massilia psychrophila TaxID=1603353 RepID=A0A2G8T4X0_9BURK|nr:ExeA family protein [Massilia psychrophila]PIL41105.1 peptidoglycan-binding protein [Massilia psychrophila]GGE66543.1 ATPase AAA [Massilia psychrophila]
MYTNYFSLRQSPFSIAPDPRYLFMSERHREALAHLLYGIGSGGGFVLLTGEIGAGKTTVCRCFIEQIPPNCKLAYIFNPKLSVEELLLSICDEFRIAPESSGAATIKTYVDAINGYLLASHAEGNNNVLVIDEAQNLSADVLEQLRLLTNLETSERKLLQIILIGQPELRAMLARPELEQLAQRVIARYHLGSLTEIETGSYIAHRLAVAGAGAVTLFPHPLVKQVYRLTRGVPRRINLLCDRALLGAYVEAASVVTPAILRRAGAEVFGEPAAPANRWPRAAGVLVAIAAVGGAAAWQLLPRNAGVPVTARVTAPARPVPEVLVKTPPPVVPAPAYASADDALRELARLWGEPLPAGEPCQAALSLNLHCYQGKGGLYELRLLDRPAILTLRDGRQVAYAVMTGLDDTTATLRVNGKQQTLSVAAIAARFDGAYTTLWSAPRGFRDEVAMGEVGPDVDWIGARLAQLNGIKAPALNQPFDRRMQKLLRDFQAAQNLKTDGVAGPRTYMRLAQLGGVSEPRLLAGMGKGQGK